MPNKSNNSADTPSKKTKLPSKKKRVQEELFNICKARNDFSFDNDLVRDIAQKHKFKNHFDVTKVDDISVMSEAVINDGYCIVHLGKGRHKFVKAATWFHQFEKIETDPIIWPYRKSILNETDNSESNILSIGFNQRIIHDFLYEDIVAGPKMYGARRTRYSISYKIGAERVNLEKVQMEIDLTTEYQGVVTVFEGKNKFLDNFAIYQLFHPFLYFHGLKKSKRIEVKGINCCYLMRERQESGSVIRLYLYTFTNPDDIGSIKLVKSAEYRLMQR